MVSSLSREEKWRTMDVGLRTHKVRNKKKGERTGEPDSSDKRCWTCSQVIKESCVR